MSSMADRLEMAACASRFTRSRFQRRPTSSNVDPYTAVDEYRQPKAFDSTLRRNSLDIPTRVVNLTKEAGERFRQRRAASALSFGTSPTAEKQDPKIRRMIRRKVISGVRASSGARQEVHGSEAELGATALYQKGRRSSLIVQGSVDAKGNGTKGWKRVGRRLSLGERESPEREPTPRERLTALLKQQRKEIGKPAGLKQQGIAQMHAMFLKYEGGEDGEISKDQFVRSLTKQFPMLAEHAGGMFDSLDLDHSGTLCFTEFVAMVCPWASMTSIKKAVDQYMKEGYRDTMIAMEIPGFITSHLKLDVEYENQKNLGRNQVDPQEREELEQMFDRLAGENGLLHAESLRKYCRGFELERCMQG
eukprot:TRINITY_DN24148_c0_g1_i1.p1 TRINITY_DN24148_c0_g1~~TRINITY_DN24148_c0_g1_i1.p1  ORF type:complete len:362 (-),score=69.50 TRINITY_DN24148_c0_g1_i1:489-1574(-)